MTALKDCRSSEYVEYHNYRHPNGSGVGVVKFTSPDLSIHANAYYYASGWFITYTQKGATTTVATIVTAETTPTEIAEMVTKTVDTLKANGLAYDPAAVQLQFEKMAAEKKGLSVEDWRASWATPVAPAPTPEPEPAKRAPRKTAPAAIDPAYFWISPRDRAFLDLWKELGAKPGVVANLMDTGPSGQGKTEKYLRFGDEQGIPVHKVDCSSIVTTEDWLGHMRVNETGTYFEKSQHVLWLEEPGPKVVLYDEINRLPATMHSTLLPILDRSKRVWAPEIGQHIEVADGTMFVATANLGSAYHGTYAMDYALESRFGYRIETSYPPVDEEIKILVNRTGIDEERATLLVEIASQIRGKVPDTLDRPVSTRNLLDTSVLVASGMTIVEAADYTFVRMYSEDGGSASQRTIVRQVLSGKASGK